MNFLYGLSALFLLAGIYLQEYSHFLINSYLESWYISKITKGFICLGLFLEFISMAHLPLSTYVILSSFHILAFKHTLIKDEKRQPSPSESFGNTAILSGCLVILLFGPSQESVSEEDFLNLFDLFYYCYSFASLALTLALRRLGWFSGKIIVETGIISQINSFTLTALKIMWVEIVVYGAGGRGYGGLCILVAMLGSFLSSSFVRAMMVDFDLVVVMGGYYIWMVFYALPLSWFVRAGIDIGVLNGAAVLFSTGLVVTGVYMHSFTKIEYLKAYKESKMNRVPDFIV